MYVCVVYSDSALSLMPVSMKDTEKVILKVLNCFILEDDNKNARLTLRFVFNEMLSLSLSLSLSLYIYIYIYIYWLDFTNEHL